MQIMKKYVEEVFVVDHNSAINNCERSIRDVTPRNLHLSITGLVDCFFLIWFFWVDRVLGELGKVRGKRWQVFSNLLGQPLVLNKLISDTLYSLWNEMCDEII